MTRLVFGMIGCLLTAMLPGCQNKQTAPVPLLTNLVGKWQWMKTVSPTRTITPQTQGYLEDLNFSNKAGSDVLAYYRNDTLRIRLTLNRSGSIQEDRSDNTLLLPVGDEYIKFFLKKNKDTIFEELEMSQLTASYDVSLTQYVAITGM